MKRSACVSLVLFAILTSIYPHPGRTDGDGGHYVGDTGEYHYHHGYSAHQHPNGICPYDDKVINDNKIVNNNIDKGLDDRNSTSKKKSKDDNIVDKILPKIDWLLRFIIITCVTSYIFALIAIYVNKPKKPKK